MPNTAHQPSADLHCDLVIIGGGIVGLATADALVGRYHGLDVMVLEKEPEVARHQTGHNSGVVHSGIYYRPGSLKARLCVEGAGRMREFCREHGLKFERCGKVVVATSEAELPRLEALFDRGVRNGVAGLRLIGPNELRDIEPLATGLRALHSPETAIVDYREVSAILVRVLRGRGARVMTGMPARSVSWRGEGVCVRTPVGSVHARYLVNCAGLYSDVVARSCGVRPRVRIVPFRGEYYWVHGRVRDAIRGLIYPVAQPELPFLGVHFTRTVHGGVEAGPNAVFALAREGYSAGTLVPAELLGTLSYCGFWRLARRFWRTGLYEAYRSASRAAFVASLRKLVPSLSGGDITRGPSGVRAQAVDVQGRLVDDFVFEETGRALHVLNAPSPAATASLAIGRYVAERIPVSSFA